MFTPIPADIRTAHAAGAIGIERIYEDGRVLFDRIDREYGHEWTFAHLFLTEEAADKSEFGLISIGAYVRRADCGAGCKCAAEYTIDPEAHDIDEDEALKTFRIAT